MFEGSCPGTPVIFSFRSVAPETETESETESEIESIAMATTKHALEAHRGHSPSDPERRGRRRQGENSETLETPRERKPTLGKAK